TASLVLHQDSQGPQMFLSSDFQQRPKSVHRLGSILVEPGEKIRNLLTYTLEAPIMTRLLGPFILIVLGGTLAAAQTADTIYYNGRVVTMWKDHPIVEAFAIRGSRFLKVGSNDEVMQAAGPATKKVDLHGHGVTPGDRKSVV